MPSAVSIRQRRRFREKYERRDGAQVPFSHAERSHEIDMVLGSRVLLKSILATGKTHTQLTKERIAELREMVKV